MVSLKKIHLYGALKKQFGDVFELDVKTPVEAVKALCHLLPNFKKEFSSYDYNVIKGELKTGWFLDESTVKMTIGNDSIHFVPVVQGSGGGSLGKIIGGIVLIGLAIASGGAALGFLGISSSQAFLMGGIMIIGGLAGGSAKTPKFSTNSLEPVESRASHIFNGPENTVEQGNAIPIIYGRIRVGSQVVSTGQNTEQI